MLWYLKAQKGEEGQFGKGSQSRTRERKEQDVRLPALLLAPPFPQLQTLAAIPNKPSEPSTPSQGVWPVVGALESIIHKAVPQVMWPASSGFWESYSGCLRAKYFYFLGARGSWSEFFFYVHKTGIEEKNSVWPLLCLPSFIHAIAHLHVSCGIPSMWDWAWRVHSYREGTEAVLSAYSVFCTPQTLFIEKGNVTSPRSHSQWGATPTSNPGTLIGVCASNHSTLYLPPNMRESWLKWSSELRCAWGSSWGCTLGFFHSPLILSQRCVS